MAAKWITNAKKNKHLSEEDRQEIQVCLSKGMTFKSIGRHIQKDPTTVFRETYDSFSFRLSNLPVL